MFTSKDEKEGRVIDLYYNQGKTYQQIAKEVKISPNDIRAILKKEEEKAAAVAASKAKDEQQENKTSKQVAAYKLFSEGKNLIQVAIDIKLPAAEVTQFYIDFLKLKELDEFSIIYEKHREDIPHILKLYRLAEKDRIGIEQLLKLAELADDNNPFGLSQLEKQRQWHLSELRRMETERHVMETEQKKYENVLFLLKSEVYALENRLELDRESCERVRQELEKLNKEREEIEESVSRGDIAE
jgi:transposase